MDYLRFLDFKNVVFSTKTRNDIIGKIHLFAALRPDSKLSGQSPSDPGFELVLSNPEGLAEVNEP